MTQKHGGARVAALLLLFVGASLGSGCECGGSGTLPRPDSDGGGLQDGGERRDGSAPRDAGPPGDGGSPPGACTVAPVPAAFERPALELHWRGEGLPFPDYEQVVMTPIVVDFVDDLDDVIPEILFVSYRTHNRPGVLRVVSGRPPYTTHLTLAGDGGGPVTDDGSATPSLRHDGHLAAGDLDGDGRVEVVALLDGGGAVAFRPNGSELWRVTAAALPSAEMQPNGSLAIADLDGDGSPEVVVGRVAIDGRSGAVLWTGTGGRGLNTQGPLSCVADVVPSSPGMEVIAGRSVYSASGAILWQAPDSTGDGFCAVADVLDGEGASGRDGAPEVIRVADGTLYIHDGASGALRWQLSLPACRSTRGQGGAPTVADFDGDGRAEIGVAGAFCYTVFDPACDADPMPAGCRQRGVLWRTDTEDDSSNVTSSTVFDFNGDGRAEVVYNDEQHFMVLDGASGEVLFREPNPSRTRTEQPIVVDVDNDGNAEIVFCANDEASFAGDSLGREQRIPGIEIWSSADDSWVGARPMWNQHTYHIDNIEPSGRIPAREPPSWVGHNTYRSNAALDAPLAAPDLTGEASTHDLSRCGEGVLGVCLEVRNVGDVRVGPGLVVAFYDGPPDAGGVEIGRSETTRTLEPRGRGERVCVDWTPAPTEPRGVWARVDVEGGARECVEDDNTVDLGPLRCLSVD